MACPSAHGLARRKLHGYDYSYTDLFTLKSLRATAIGLTQSMCSYSLDYIFLTDDQQN